MKFSVCVGSACHVKGSYNVLLTLRQRIADRLSNTRRRENHGRIFHVDVWDILDTAG